MGIYRPLVAIYLNAGSGAQRFCDLSETIEGARSQNEQHVWGAIVPRGQNKLLSAMEIVGTGLSVGQNVLDVS